MEDVKIFDYTPFIKQTAKIYSNSGYCEFRGKLANSDLFEKLGPKRYGILIRVIDDLFLKPRNGSANTRVLGFDNKRDIADLARRCLEMEDSSIDIPPRQS